MLKDGPLSHFTSPLRRPAYPVRHDAWYCCRASHLHQRAYGSDKTSIVQQTESSKCSHPVFSLKRRIAGMSTDGYKLSALQHVSVELR